MKNYSKKVLLCDSSFSAIPILDALKSKGFYVGVCGARISDPCHAIADESFLFDYSNKEKLLDTFQSNHFNYLVPGCTDVSYLSSSWVANQLGLPGYDKLDSTQIIHDKGIFRAFSKSNHYPIPMVAHSFVDAKKLKFPILIKPTNSFSGKGIQKIDQPSQLNEAYCASLKTYSNEEFLFEEFIEGDLFSHSAFIKNKEVFFDFFVREYCTVYPYQVNSSNLSSKLSLEAKNKMRTWLRRFVNDINMSDGLFHTQFLSKHNEIWLVESARRCPGDLYSKLIQLSTGADYPQKYISSFCEIELTSPLEMKSNPISRHTVSTKEECTYIASSLKLPHIESTFIALKKPGEILKPAPYDRAGIYFIEHASHDLMEKYTEKLAQHIKVITSPSTP
jgi:biotin carboxylase